MRDHLGPPSSRRPAGTSRAPPRFCGSLGTPSGPESRSWGCAAAPTPRVKLRWTSKVRPSRRPPVRAPRLKRLWFRSKLPQHRLRRVRSPFRRSAGSGGVSLCYGRASPCRRRMMSCPRPVAFSSGWSHKIHTFGGRVEELGHTGLDASFGLEPIEDAPRRAANAAMALLKAVQRVRSQNAEMLGVKIPCIRCPIRSGKSTTRSRSTRPPSARRGRFWTRSSKRPSRTLPSPARPPCPSSRDASS